MDVTGLPFSRFSMLCVHRYRQHPIIYRFEGNTVWSRTVIIINGLAIAIAAWTCEIETGRAWVGFQETRPGPKVPLGWSVNGPRTRWGVSQEAVYCPPVPKPPAVV